MRGPSLTELQHSVPKRTELIEGVWDRDTGSFFAVKEVWIDNSAPKAAEIEKVQLPHPSPTVC